MKKITLQLSPADMQRAVSTIEEFQKRLENGAQKFVDELSKKGVSVATLKFSNAEYDGTNDVSVKAEKKGDRYTAIVATDSLGNGTALFIEFGTGVSYASPEHPEASVNGMIRGQYGKKQGSNPKGWFYQGTAGSHGETPRNSKLAERGFWHTYGNPANMCMYKTVRELEQMIEEVAKRCFI